MMRSVRIGAQRGAARLSAAGKSPRRSAPRTVRATFCSNTQLSTPDSQPNACGSVREDRVDSGEFVGREAEMAQGRDVFIDLGNLARADQGGGDRGIAEHPRQ